MGRIGYILSPKKLRRDIKKEKKLLEEEAANAAAAARHIPKTFEFYCPSCLFQTNDELSKCPKCDFGPLKRAG